jgi:gluconolactonase
VWDRKGGYLLFSDTPANVIDKWNPVDRKISVFLNQPSSGNAVQTNGSSGTATASSIPGSNGITLDRQGRVVYVSVGDHAIVRLEKDGRRTVLASQYDGKPLSVPNDLVYKSDGALYFTDPGVRDSPDIPTVYLLKGGKLRIATRDVSFPNGLAFAPGEKYLYVNNTLKSTITRFDLRPDDTLSNARLIIDENADGAHAYPDHGYPDGMKVDQKGNIYCTGPGGLWIVSPQGKHLGTILFDENNVEPKRGIGVSNLAFGDADGKTLYLTARTALYRVRLKIPGIRP